MAESIKSMKLLFITQKVDINDDLLGVYHDWIAKLAEKVEKINVICLFKGEYHLPSNVAVYSLGKEEGGSRPKYLKNFFRHIWELRRDYDSVFVHMNKEYILLGGLFWRLLGKKIVFWYAHYLINWQLRLAVLLSQKVVTSTKLACAIRSKKLEVIGQGVDTDYFRNLNYEKDHDKINLLFLGRISPVKNLETLIEALALFKQKRDDIFLNIVGAPTEKDGKYYEEMKNLISRLNLEGSIKFWGKVGHRETFKFYNQNDIYINLTPTGSFDKTILEAMACECLAVVCNKAFQNEIPPDFIFGENRANDLARKLEKIVKLPLAERSQIAKRMRQFIVEKHSIMNLVSNLIKQF